MDRDEHNALLRTLSGITAAIHRLSISFSGGTKTLLTDKEAALFLGFKRNRNTAKPDYKGFMDRVAPRLKLGKPVYVARRRHWIRDVLVKAPSHASTRLARGKRGGK